MAEDEADQHLFGEYQRAKKRWRRFSGKPVRTLRRVLSRKRKGRGKNKSKQRNSYLNTPEILQYYFKGKGKGKPRRINRKDKQGQITRCSICGSMYHLRARCVQGPSRHLFTQERIQCTSQPSSRLPPLVARQVKPTILVGPMLNQMHLHCSQVM